MASRPIISPNDTFGPFGGGVSGKLKLSNQRHEASCHLKGDTKCRFFSTEQSYLSCNHPAAVPKTVPWKFLLGLHLLNETEFTNASVAYR